MKKVSCTSPNFSICFNSELKCYFDNTSIVSMEGKEVADENKREKGWQTIQKESKQINEAGGTQGNMGWRQARGEGCVTRGNQQTTHTQHSPGNQCRRMQQEWLFEREISFLKVFKTQPTFLVSCWMLCSSQAWCVWGTVKSCPPLPLPFLMPSNHPIIFCKKPPG